MKQQPKNIHRIEKVNAFIQQALGPILLEFQQGETGLITISKVETSRDMKWCKVWISILGGDDEKILNRLTKEIYDIQGALNRQFSSKIVPRLSFHLDTTPRHAQHINELIKKIHEEGE